MVEDMAKNLVPAAALGMTTAWVRGTIDWAAAGAEGGHIHHVVDNLGRFPRRPRRSTAVALEAFEPCPSPTRSAAS